MAYWGGEGRVGYAGRPDDVHRITFDCGWLSRHGVRVRGTVGVYDVHRRYGWAEPVYVDRVDAHLADVRMSGGTALYGREVASFPPFEALCLYGGPSVEEWLLTLGFDRTDYVAAMSTDIGEAYQEESCRRSPNALTPVPYAVLGGWHLMWPEDDYYLPREMRLACATLRDAEPWVEVFQCGINMPTRCRIS